MLDVDRTTIDACRFEDRVESSRTVRNDELALDLLTDALAMWRGRPYEDAEESDALEAESRRLEALWSEALDRRIRLDLDRGRHRQLVAELETLVADHPHHENLRAHQMVALYRCGRQADALHAYRAAEERLRDELGVDPSPELRELEHRILVQDRTLDYRPKARLRGIPARFTSFVGRGSDVERLADLIRHRRLVTVTGPGGVGKSSLAVEAVRSLAEDYPSAYVPIEANREADPWQLIAASIGMSGGDVDVRAVIDAIGGATLILVLDGCEHLLDVLSGTVTELLTRCANLRLVLTSREALGVTGEHTYQLGPLEHGEGSPANDLFLDRAGIDVARLGENELTDVTLIGRRLSGLPLGLELAAARTRTMSVSEISERLDDQVSLLQAGRGSEPRRRSIGEAIGWSYDLLDDEAQRVFRHVGAFPTGTIHVDAVAAVVGTDAPREALEPLPRCLPDLEDRR